MALYTPNFAAHAPATMDWDGDALSDRAMAHSSLLIVPERSEGVDIGYQGFSGDLLCPPPLFMALMYCKEWSLIAEVSGAGQTLSVGQSISGLGKWSEVIPAGTIGGTIFDEESEDSETGNYVRLRISFGSSIKYAWDTGEWWGGIRIILDSRDFDTSDFVSVAGTGSSGDLMSVSCYVSGYTIPLYYNFEETAPSITGSISLTPVSYLTVE